MAQCATCGNDYDKAFAVGTAEGAEHAYDSIEYAAQMIAPACARCRVFGHGVEAADLVFCCAAWASAPDPTVRGTGSSPAAGSALTGGVAGTNGGDRAAGPAGAAPGGGLRRRSARVVAASPASTRAAAVSCALWRTCSVSSWTWGLHRVAVRVGDQAPG